MDPIRVLAIVLTAAIGGLLVFYGSLFTIIAIGPIGLAGVALAGVFGLLAAFNVGSYVRAVTGDSAERR
ncbi:hypothetical protein ACFQDG_10920 [Natronoarchaeum mannanilyticum]|uniref:Major facilitator superfamily (MFS) profile domain-containing protein n=1 Tax=Natronoarchaeum mannanilyticum TaxID=926360 RepID=A0AAV3T689_9EURY